jgi:GNAT superfamily N-acetyltransferase
MSRLQYHRQMSVQHCTVRQATMADLEVIAPLFDAYRQFYRKPPDPSLAQTFIADRLRNNESVIFLAHDADGTPTGFTQLYPSFSSGAAARIFILNDLFVTPSARRSGAGRALLDAAAEFARGQGAVRLTLSTEVSNKTAQALYEAEGWKLQTDYYVYTLHPPT